MPLFFRLPQLTDDQIFVVTGSCADWRVSIPCHAPAEARSAIKQCRGINRYVHVELAILGRHGEPQIIQRYQPE